MRCFKLLILGGLLLALAGPAMAVTVPAVPGGVMFLHSRDQDNGTAYVYNVGGGSITFDPRLGLPVGVSSFGAPGAMTIDPDGVPVSGDEYTEDSWGIFALYSVEDGIMLPDGKVDALPGGNLYFDNANGLQTTWLVGVFYGGQDTSVTIDNSAAANTLVVDTQNVQFELWAVDKALIAPAPDRNQLVPYPNTRPAVDEYTGWLDATTKVGAVKLLTGTSTFFQFQGDVSNTAPNKFTGSTEVWFDIDETDASGIWNQYWGQDEMQDPNGVPADAWLQYTLENSAYGWNTHSYDIGGAVVVPEPLTMAGMLLGIGCLGRYIRRRK